MNKEARPPDQERHGEGEIYLYKEAGIWERHGKIPLWLVFVAIALLIWGVYYTVKYWNTA